MKKHILIVEDDENIRTVMTDLLELEGFQVQAVTNGLEALQALVHSPHPCLILLDLSMPVMDGHEFLDKLAEQGSFGHIPVVISSCVPDRNSLKSKGVAAILQKPCDLDLLLSTVHKYCGLDGEKPIF